LWYTVHEPAAADGGGEDAASAGPLPIPAAAPSTAIMASNPVVLKNQKDRATRRERERSTPERILADPVRYGYR
jgi:hypothetical protein